jgi:monoamine oxidase
MSAQPSAPVADVVVVGGGLSGLTVALRMASATPRLSVVLLESRDRLGGRLYADGGVDLGGSWSWPTDTALRGLAKGMHGPRSAFYLIIACTHCACIMNSLADQVGCILQKLSSWVARASLLASSIIMHVL